MTEIRVIDPIEVTDQGPSVPGPNGYRQSVHLMQGSLDGACGPYSLMMALIICGVVDREQAASYGPIDRRTVLGRLLDEWHHLGPLVKGGTDPVQLASLLARTYGRRLGMQFEAGQGAEIRSFIENHIGDNHPALLAVSHQDGAHWVVVIGVEYQIRGIERNLSRLLVLDPAAHTPTLCAWNGVIEARGGGGRYPYEYSTARKSVSFSFALALWPKHAGTESQ